MEVKTPMDGLCARERNDMYCLQGFWQSRPVNNWIKATNLLSKDENLSAT